MRNFRLTTVVIPMLILTMTTAPILSGCSKHKTTTVTTTEVDGPRARYYEPHEETTVRTETTSTSDEKSENHGVFHILADIISLPFRAVGALFTAIF